MKKYAVIWMLVAALMWSCGCGSRTEPSVQSSEPVPVESVDENKASEAMPYYTAEFLLEGLGFSNVYCYTQWQDQLLCVTYANEESYQVPQGLSWRDLEGFELAAISPKLSKTQGILGVDVTSDGTIYLLAADYVSDARNQDGMGFTKSDYENYRLMKLSHAGELLSDTPAELDGECHDLVVTDSGEIYVVQCLLGESGWFDDHSIIQLDENGAAVASVQPGECIFDLFQDTSGALYVILQNSVNQIYPFSMEATDCTTPLIADASTLAWPEYAVYDQLYVADDAAGFYAYDGSGQGGLLFRWEELPVTLTNNVRFVAAEDEATWIFCCYVNGGGYLLRVHGQTEPPPETEKTKLVIGCVGDGVIESAVVEYNILHTDVELEIRDYYELVKNHENLDEYTELLNQDIINGDGPDILVLGSTFHIGTYAGNGYLMDLQPLMDADESLNPEAYFTNIWDSGKLYGKQYALATNFDLETLVGKQDTLGAESGWTPSECLEIARGSDTPMLLEGDLDTWKRVLLSTGLNDYIDGNTCSFDSGEFAALLTLLAGGGSEAELSDVEINFPLQSGCALTDCQMVHASDLLFADGLFGENWVFKGFPSPKESAAFIEIWTAYGIAETCQNKDLAWEFVRSQLDSGRLAFNSVKRESIESELEQAMLPEDDPSSLAAHSWYSMGDVEIDAKPITQAQADAYIHMIENASCAMVDPNVEAIVKEETDAFFAGDKTAEETASIIQNRVSIYLGERS